MESNNLYLVKHAASASEIEIECILDQRRRARVGSATLINGNVIPLQGVRRALEHYKEQCSDDSGYEDEHEDEETDDDETDEPA